MKELRERTGAGMMECKSALKEANGDMAEAEVVLRKRGISSAEQESQPRDSSRDWFRITSIRAASWAC